MIPFVNKVSFLITSTVTVLGLVLSESLTTLGASGFGRSLVTVRASSRGVARECADCFRVLYVNVFVALASGIVTTTGLVGVSVASQVLAVMVGVVDLVVGDSVVSVVG